MPLRKVMIRSNTLTDNAASFTNVTAKRLHILKMVLKVLQRGTIFVDGDQANVSIDEIPIAQKASNDSRSHIGSVDFAANTIAVTIAQTLVLTWNRDDFVLDPDESIFMNIEDQTGAPAISGSCNLWYDD